MTACGVRNLEGVAMLAGGAVASLYIRMHGEGDEMRRGVAVVLDERRRKEKGGCRETPLFHGGRDLHPRQQYHQDSLVVVQRDVVVHGWLVYMLGLGVFAAAGVAFVMISVAPPRSERRVQAHAKQKSTPPPPSQQHCSFSRRPPPPYTTTQNHQRQSAPRPRRCRLRPCLEPRRSRRAHHHF